MAHLTTVHDNTARTIIGSADFIVDGRVHKTWYQYYGDLNSGPRLPLVILHGGPGLSHDYMLPHRALYNDADIPLVFYDQLGCGKSTHLPEEPVLFWSMDLYMDELENLLRHLGITQYDLLGHSWGGMLASNFAAARQPRGLRKLILTNCPASMSLATAGINKLMEGFPVEFYEMLKKHEADGTVNSDEYKSGQMTFAQRHICTLNLWPAELIASFEENQKDSTVNMALMGGYFLQTVGTMKDWNVIPILHKVTAPTLLLHSPTDEVHDIAIKPFFEQIPKIKWVEFYHSSHLAQFEEPERYFKVLTDFLL